MHELLVERMQPKPGERWLDLATGTGRVAELLPPTGATVVGVDLAPALLETARSRAAEQGLAIDYRVGDCERLDGIDDASFDGVTSVVGIMFAPDHAATAAQLARVMKPGGRLGLANWRGEGGVGDLFKLMAPFQPAPPPSSPFDWGDEEIVTGLLGEQFELEFSSEDTVYEFPTGETYWELMSTHVRPDRRRSSTRSTSTPRTSCTKTGSRTTKGSSTATGSCSTARTCSPWARRR